MKGRLTLQQRLALPIVLLGLIALLSNILAVFSINNVHANAGTIVDQYMVSEARLEEIRRSMMDIHRLALSHIVAADHATMIQLVQEIKAEEAALDEKLGAYQEFVSEKEREAYQSLQDSYGEFKHALVYLVSASADSKTQEAYATANWPMPQQKAAEDIARRMETTLDPRTVLTSAYPVPYPTDDLGEVTMTDVLEWMAVVNAGNWVMSDEGRLLLLRFGDIPPETGYLVTEHGRAITLGWVRLLVG